MRYKSVSKLALHMWTGLFSGDYQGDLRTINLQGPPGIGKTSVAHSIAADMQRWVDANPVRAREAGINTDQQVLVHEVDLTSSLPEDIGGVPLPEGKKVGENEIPLLEYALQHWMVDFMDPGAYGVLVLDDLPAAMPAIQAAVRKLVLQRAIHGRKLSPNVLLMVTGNRRQDGAGASTLPSHFRNAVITVTIEPRLDEWMKWYGAQGGHDPIIPAFLATINGGTNFSQLPDKSDELGAFATPRTWAMLGQMYTVAEAAGELVSVAHGLVGNAAVEFIAFKEIKSRLVSPEKVLLDPKGALPDPIRQLDSPDKAVAMVTGLAEHAIMWLKGDDPRRQEMSNERFLLALAWTVQGGLGEHVATCIHHWDALGGNTEHLVPLVTKHAANPEVRALIMRLKNIFRAKG